MINTGRRLVFNPLRIENGRYEIDFGQLEQCAEQGARLLFLCSPHNPVSRVWIREELEEILRIARRHGLIVLSDEIHADLVYPDFHHTPLAALADRGENIVTAVAPSKTFNIPGLGLSALIVPNPEQRAAIGKAFDMLHVSAANPFSIAAFEAAYQEGEEWLDKLLAYLQETRDFVSAYLRRHLPSIHLIPAEGTYLLWLDCQALGMPDRQLQNFFVHDARVGMSAGAAFGQGGSGFMRLNIATPRHIVVEALDRIRIALNPR